MGCAHCTPAAPDNALSALVLVLSSLQRIEAHMATAAEQITALGAKVDDIAADFAAFRDAMEAERENLTAAGQAALDEVNAKLANLDASVGDADGSDTPTPDPEVPGDGEPDPEANPA